MTGAGSAAPFRHPPASVAVVGASPRRFFARWTVENLIRHGFDRERLFLVHPVERTMLGLEVHPSIDALPSPPEMAVLALGAPGCPAAVRALRDRGCRTVVVLSDGFAETQTAAGVALQEELVAAAAGITLVGPNGMGMADVPGRVVAIGGPVPGTLSAGPVSVVSQSGGLVATFLSGLSDEGAGADLCLSIGNGAAFSMADALTACAARPATSVVVAYVEGLGTEIGPVAAALDALAASGRRVVALVAGRSAAGRRSVESHTARAAGPHALVTSLLEAHGAVVVPDAETLVRTAVLAPVLGRRRGGVAVVTGSGGAASLAADAAEAAGMPLARYGPRTAQALAALVPASGTAANPTDLSGGTTDATAVMAAVAADPGVAAVLVPFPAPFPDASPERADHRRFVEAAAGACDATGCALVVASVVPQAVPDWVAGLRARPGTAVVEGLGCTARALGLLLGTGDVPELGEVAGRDAGEDGGGTGPVVAVDPRFGSEADGRALLEAAGLATVPGVACRSADDLVGAGRALGFPVVAKGVVPGVPHKAAVGAVSGPVCHAAALREACRVVAARCAAAGTPAEGFLVERLAGGTELFLGLRRHAVYGPSVTLGLGGTLAETALARATAVLGPDGAVDVGQLVRRAGLGPVVRASGLGAALGTYVERACRAFVEGPLAGCVTVEVNPLFLSEELGVVAADVLVEWAGPPPAPAARA